MGQLSNTSTAFSPASFVPIDMLSPRETRDLSVYRRRIAAIIDVSREIGVDRMATGILRSAEPSSLADSLREFHTETGRSLLELVDESPVLLIFLRHFSCAFCAMALDRVSQVRQQIEAKGVRPVFVHLGSPERAKPYFDYYRLTNIETISNPEAPLYQLPVFRLS